MIRKIKRNDTVIVGRTRSRPHCLACCKAFLRLAALQDMALAGMFNMAFPMFAFCRQGNKRLFADGVLIRAGVCLPGVWGARFPEQSPALPNVQNRLLSGQKWLYIGGIFL